MRAAVAVLFVASMAWAQTFTFAPHGRALTRDVAAAQVIITAPAGKVICFADVVAAALPKLTPYATAVGRQEVEDAEKQSGWSIAGEAINTGLDLAPEVLALRIVEANPTAASIVVFGSKAAKVMLGHFVKLVPRSKMAAIADLLMEQNLVMPLEGKVQRLILIRNQTFEAFNVEVK